MSFYKNTENRTMLKLDNLIYKSKNLLFKQVENNKIQKNKLHQHKLAKLNSIKLLKSLKNNTIKDISCLPNGKKSPKLLLKEIKILIEQAKILQVLWIKSTKINKFQIKEKNNQMDKRNSIERNKPRMFQEIETLVIEKINLKDQNFKEQLIYKLKFKSLKINFHHSLLSLLKPEMESHLKIKIYFKRNKGFKLNKLNLMLYKLN